MYRLAFYLLYPLVWLYCPVVVRPRVLLVVGEEGLVVRSRFGSGRLQVPGGGKARRETRKAAAVRELREELGIQVSEDELEVLLPYGLYWDEGLLYRTEVFMIRLASRPEVVADTHELTAVSWQPLLASTGLSSLARRCFKEVTPQN